MANDAWKPPGYYTPWNMWNMRVSLSPAETGLFPENKIHPFADRKCQDCVYVK